MKLIRKLVGMLTAAALSVGLLSSLPKSYPTAEAVDVGSLTAKQISEQMGLGWNLGNTLEAHAKDNNSNEITGLLSEVTWSNPRATEQLIKAVRAKGFTTIRIPVTWGNHLVSGNTIDPIWFKRVHEVVDMALDEGFYVILNMHHENDWLIPDNNHYASDSVKLKAIWEQIATEFKSYDKHLIFEGMNEPRTVGSAKEWTGGTPEERSVINKLNNDFVDTVRQTGGTNSTRALMIPTYAASNDHEAMTALSLPNDSNLIVSVHAYTPYPFAMNGHSTYDNEMESQLAYFFEELDNIFLNNGIPVCIGEFGASNYSNDDERAKWAASYAGKAKQRNVPIVIWDNNTVSDPSAPSECYGLINRDTMTWYSSGEKLVKALTDTFGLTQTDYTPVYGDGNIRITTSDWWGEKSVTKSQLLAGHKADEIVSITVKCNYRMQIGGSKEIFEYTISKDNIPDQLKIGVTAPSGRTATVWWEIKLAASRLVGDLNEDGNITADDAIIAARLAAGYGDYATRYDSDVADMNRDGKVTADDAIIIARYAAGYPGYADKYTKYV